MDEKIKEIRAHDQIFSQLSPELTSKVYPVAVVGQLLEDVVLLDLVAGKVGRHVDKRGQAPRRQACIRCQNNVG